MVAPAAREGLDPTRSLAELDAWLAGFGIPAMAPRHLPPAAGEWSPEEAEAIELLASLRPEDLPAGLRLDGRATVTDPGRFLASLRGAAAAGPGGNRARNGALQADLAALLAAVKSC